MPCAFLLLLECRFLLNVVLVSLDQLIAELILCCQKHSKNAWILSIGQRKQPTSNKLLVQLPLFHSAPKSAPTFNPRRRTRFLA